MAVIETKRSAEDATAPVQHEVPVYPCSNVDASLLVVKERGKSKNGPIIGVSYNSNRLALNLTAGKEWLTTPFGMERNSMFAKESAEVEFDSLPFSIELPDSSDAQRAIEALDASAKEQLQKFMPNVQWHPSIRKTEGYPDRLNPKVVLRTTNMRDCTTFHVRPHGREIVKGSGADFIEPLLKANRNFRQAKVKLVIALHKIWVNGGKAGIVWRVVTMVADLPQQQEIVYEEVFGDDVFDQ
jgi:hypothetical protein